MAHVPVADINSSLRGCSSWTPCVLMHKYQRTSFISCWHIFHWAVSSSPLCLSLPLQNFLRCQNNKNNYNLVCETLQFLDCICGSTTGGLGLLGLYINEKNVALINQTVESLTEYCQGPCHENQVDIWAHVHGQSYALNMHVCMLAHPDTSFYKPRLVHACKCLLCTCI